MRQTFLHIFFFFGSKSFYRFFLRLWHGMCCVFAKSVICFLTVNLFTQINIRCVAFRCCYCIFQWINGAFESEMRILLTFIGRQSKDDSMLTPFHILNVYLLVNQRTVIHKLMLKYALQMCWLLTLTRLLRRCKSISCIVKRIESFSYFSQSNFIF